VGRGRSERATGRAQQHADVAAEIVGHRGVQVAVAVEVGGSQGPRVLAAGQVQVQDFRKTGLPIALEHDQLVAAAAGDGDVGNAVAGEIGGDHGRRAGAGPGGVDRRLETVVDVREQDGRPSVGEVGGDEVQLPVEVEVGDGDGGGLVADRKLKRA